MNKVIIEIDRVTVSYRESLALNSVSLKIDTGDFVAVAGPNGAGKTTLLTAVNGLGRLWAGRVRVFGEDLTRRNSTRLRKDIGFVHQITKVDSRMPIRVEEAVMLGRIGKIGLFRMPGRDDFKAAAEAMEMVGISDLSRRLVGTLSGGEEKKVAIARVLAQKPRILLLDEPITNLDINAQVGILDLIDSIHKREKLTIVMVLHHINLLPRMCKRMVLVKQGRIVFDGDADKALSSEVLSGVYGAGINLIKERHGIIRV